MDPVLNLTKHDVIVIISLKASIDRVETMISRYVKPLLIGKSSINNNENDWQFLT